MSKRVIAFLGSDWETIRYFKKVQKFYPDLLPIQAAYGKRLDWTAPDQFVKLHRGREIEELEKYLESKGNKLAALVNRVDSYILLSGKLVEHFELKGARLDSLRWFKDKALFDDLVRRAGWGERRPETQVLELDRLEDSLRSIELPVIVKPVVGSKSRGVIKIKKTGDIGGLKKRYKEYFQSELVHRYYEGEAKVLVEEWVEGHQVTATLFVDSGGKVTLLGVESVWTGEDMGQAHQQLVLRTVPSRHAHKVTGQILELMEALVQKTGLESTFLFPEFKLRGNDLKIIEVNVRLGGYRTEMYKYAYGIDLRRASIELALGKDCNVSKSQARECGAVELWGEISGRVKEVRVPKGAEIREAKVLVRSGQSYLAPPAGDIPLARFFVVSGDEIERRALAAMAEVKVELA